MRLSRSKKLLPGLLLAPCAFAWSAGVRCGIAEAVEGKDAPSAPKPAEDPGGEIYTVAELLNRAETIVVAELGLVEGNGTRLNIMEVLKLPSSAAPVKLPEKQLLERASDLLNQEATLRAEREKEKKGPKPLPHPAGAPAAKLPAPALPALAIVAGGRIPLPRPGTQALFFLWERAAPEGDSTLRYRLSHPQGLYGADLAPSVKLSLSRRNPADRERYLREWDERMAKRQALRKDDEVLKKLSAANQESGLRLLAPRPKRSIRDDNTFDVNVRFENSRGYDQAIYDGTVNCFGVRLRKKNAPPEEAVVLRASLKRLAEGLDPATLALVDANDFELVPKNGARSKELHFDAQEHPALAALDGEYVVNVFYVSAQDGKGLEDLPAAPLDRHPDLQRFSPYLQSALCRHAGA